MTGRRVFVTGVGQVSAVGIGLPAFATPVFEGLPAVRPLDLTAPGLPRPIGAAVPGFDPLAFLPARLLPTTSLSGRYALAAGAEALAGAGLDRAERPRGGVAVGTGFGPIAEIEDTYGDCFSRPGARPRPTIIPTAMANGAAGLLASELRLKGPNLTFTVACASASHAIGHALRLLREGDVDVMLAGGTDAPLTPVVLGAWNAMRVLAPAGDDPARACRPFAADRQGIVIGEGAAFLVLETEDHARARGAQALAELVGYGANADAGHLTHPDPEGVRKCLELSLADARLAPDAIDYVNAHGTGTEVNDRVEASALAAVFGGRPVAVSSTKAVHGHAMGASGALEAVATVLALRDGRLPPTATLREADPRLPRLDYVSEPGRRAVLRAALSSSFAFGGNNAVLAFRALT